MTFNRLPGESHKAFEAFQTFLGLGHERSNKRVGLKLGKSTALIDRWSSRYKWKQRLKTYVSHMAAIQRQSEEDNIKKESNRWAERARELKEQEWEMAEKLMAKAQDMMAFPLTKEVVNRKGEDGESITVVQPAKWSLADMARLIDLSSKLRRMAAGMATDRSELSGIDGGPIQTEHTTIVEGLEDDHVDAILSELYNGKACAVGLR